MSTYWPIRFALLGALLFAPTLQAQQATLREKRDRLWSEYKVKLADATIPSDTNQLYFLPSTQYQPDSVAQQRIANEYADQLIELAKSNLTESAVAYQFLHEAAYFGTENLADKIVNEKTTEIRVRQATQSHPRLRWRRREYYRVTSEHYQVVTRDEQAGRAIAQRLETLYAVWRQVFLDCWSTDAKLRSALERGKTLVPNSRNLHRVVLFSNQQEYTAFLGKEQPRIGITKGFYDIVARTSYFFAGANATHSTQLHEVTHQLFQEVQRTSERLKMAQNFWIIEGIAMYMESLQKHGSVASVGGVGANRLQFARYRRLQEDFYMPLEDLVRLGRTELQQDPQIRRIYSQSAGLTHFLMDAQQARHRNGLIRYLRLIYSGRDRIDALSKSLKTDVNELDERYAQFLRVSDEELLEAAIPKDSLHSLCLGRTSVTNTGLRALAAQGKLDWLDLAALPIDQAGLGFLEETRSLRQVSFDQCRNLGDEAVQLISQNASLEELDLSGTAVTDQGLKHLAGHPSLQTIWLTNTGISSDAVSVLSNLAQLRTLGCGGTQLSASDIEKIRKKRPNLEIVE